MHERLCFKIEELNLITNKSGLNKKIDVASSKKYGVIASSSAYNYAHDVIKFNNLDVDILKLGFSYPFPDKLVREFLKDLDEVFIVEEIDPIIEKDTLACIGQNELDVTIHGKLDNTFPRCMEFNSKASESVKKQIDFKGGIR